MGDDEIIGLADAVNTKVSEKLTWLLLRVLNFCKLKIPKRKPSCAERTTFRSPDNSPSFYKENQHKKLECEKAASLFSFVYLCIHLLRKAFIKKKHFLLTFVNKRGEGGLERASSIKKTIAKIL